MDKKWIQMILNINILLKPEHFFFRIDEQTRKKKSWKIISVYDYGDKIITLAYTVEEFVYIYLYPTFIIFTR